MQTCPGSYCSLGKSTLRASAKLLVFSSFFVFLIVMPTVATDPEDAAADVVSTAFLQVRQAAHLSKLDKMGRNTFREKACKQDLRFPPGLINDVTYETSDPERLPESAQRLATWLDTGKTAARVGLGVCLLDGSAQGRPKFSVFIATYESRWTSFWRIFWD